MFISDVHCVYYLLSIVSFICYYQLCFSLLFIIFFSLILIVFYIMCIVF
ncbi:hypothetical protein Hanom_Chr01g00025271 [Helianthus anomalus]